MVHLLRTYILICKFSHLKYEYGHLGSWYIKLTLYKRLVKIFKKNKVYTGKSPLFVINSYCLPFLFVLTLASDMAVFYGNDGF